MSKIMCFVTCESCETVAHCQVKNSCAKWEEVVNLKCAPIVTLHSSADSQHLSIFTPGKDDYQVIALSEDGLEGLIQDGVRILLHHNRRRRRMGS